MVVCEIADLIVVTRPAFECESYKYAVKWYFTWISDMDCMAFIYDIPWYGPCHGINTPPYMEARNYKVYRSHSWFGIPDLEWTLLLVFRKWRSTSIPNWCIWFMILPSVEVKEPMFSVNTKRLIMYIWNLIFNCLFEV